MSSGGKGKLKPMVHVGPNMTPMVDVVMCILIFFMLASSFVLPELFLKSSMPAIDKAGLGQQAADAKMPAVKLWIKMQRKADDTYVSAFDWAPVKMDHVDDPSQDANINLKALFDKKGQELSPDVQIIIHPAADVSYQDVITVYDDCVSAKFKQVAFAPAG